MPNVPQNRTAGPGPIQRPATQVHHSQPVVAHPAKTYTAPPIAATAAAVPETDFKKIQRKKMLEDTKRYFEKEHQPITQNISEKVVKEKKAETTPVTNPELSKHDKYILPDSTKELKKYDRDQKKRSDQKSRHRNRGTVKSVVKKPLDSNKPRNANKV